MINPSLRKGLQDGIPIALGYFSVSVAFGMACRLSGLDILQGAVLSFTNLTSAGQFAGVQLLAIHAGYLEILLTELVINSRYFLMGLSLSQKMVPNMPLWKRLLVSYGITDEIFAVAIGQKGKLSASYMAGLTILPVIGWTGGTITGALFSDILPPSVSQALGIALYAMFIAIIIPAARKEKSVFICVLLAAGLSCLFALLPGLRNLSSGYTVILITLVVSALCATLFPRPDEEDV